ncbi:NikR family transcription regulator [Natronomonas pharaonis DSM 2160]|uniref:NikR family transcription regulator n=1 Tax=Natronomonas pharaonis (strain ATCC 35678 / DSM 2160 / CIP 103997 / JCM 8858 / NBRC 14720 / NCIMB 2260 / Gabara) TaxID=348780 RepID=A0A1U7EUF7_NATPD|nr:CopG family ribbon-helix-helix protein [Natronomonas pharaonis]CAI48608.1 NikR family transcription regulator [Natronomonas pharaonis DSM 2160]
MPVVSVSMPASLLDRLDEFIDEHDYSGRSEAVREGTRKVLTEFDDQSVPTSPAVCIVAVMFDHDTDAESSLSTLRHEHDELVTSNVHSHAGEACLELFVAEGEVDAIGTFVSRVRTVDGVGSVEYTFVDDNDEIIPR